MTPSWVYVNFRLQLFVSISLAHLATGIFSHSSRQNCSSSFKLDGFHWCTAIFKSYHRFSIGLRSVLWLGHSKTFKCFHLSHSNVALAVCLGSLSCSKVNLRPSLKSQRLKQVSLKNFPVFSTIQHSFNSDQFPSPCRWKTSPQHDAATTMLHCGDSDLGVMRGVGFARHSVFLDGQKAQF